MKNIILWIFLVLLSLPSFASDFTEKIGEVVLSRLSERQLVVARKNLKEYRRRATVLKKIFRHPKKTRADQRDVLLIISSTERSLIKLPSELSFIRDQLLSKLESLKQQTLEQQWESVEEELGPWASSVLLLSKI